MRTPRILVTDGWITDQNGSLTEVVIPSSVKTFQIPTKVTFEGTTLNAVPSTAAKLQEFDAPNITAISKALFAGYSALTKIECQNLSSLYFYTSNTQPWISGNFYNCSSLTTVIMPNLQSITNYGGRSYNGYTTAYGTFYNCSNLVSVSFPKLVSISNSGDAGNVGIFNGCIALTSIDMPLLQTITNNGDTNCGVFRGCTALTSISLPELLTFNNSGSSFYGCSSLSTVYFPKLQIITSGSSANRGAFSGCTNLTSVQFGSVGYPVTTIGSYTFGNCTQSNLTITVYTNNGASLSGSPWGATNATIVYEEA